MSKTEMAELEVKIKELTAQRAQIFEEWARTVKHNDRHFEEFGIDIPELTDKAAELLQAQREISNQIITCLDRLSYLQDKNRGR